MSTQFILTTLSEQPEFFEDVIRLIEEEFHYSNAHHFEKDFAPLVDPNNFENCFLYIDRQSNKVAAHLAVCPRTLIQGKHETKIALIGGIVTDKKFRNLNLFKNLMDHALLKFAKKVSLFILWSDIEGLYERFHFYRTGGTIETGKKTFTAEERPVGYEKTTFARLSGDEMEQVISLYTQFNQQYFCTIKREDKDWSIIKNMDSIDLYLKKDENGRVLRYFCCNKGRDLTNIIHEISGRDLKEYSSLIKEIENFKTWLPECEATRLSSKDIYFTAFFRLGDKARLNRFLEKVTSKDLQIKELGHERVDFEFKGGPYSASSREFLQYLFGPGPLAELAPYKLSLYIAGTDSI